jgi:hypothetical protein
LLLAINKVGCVEGSQLKTVAVRDRVGWACFNAISAEDTAVVVDVVHMGIAFGAADPVLSRVLSSFDVDTVGRTGSRAQETRYTLLQPVFVALQHVKTAKALLENRAMQWPWTIRIILDNRGPEHLPEGDCHAFGDGSDVLHDRHIWIIPVANFADSYNKRLVGELIDELQSEDVAFEATHDNLNNIGLLGV